MSWVWFESLAVDMVAGLAVGCHGTYQNHSDGRSRDTWNGLALADGEPEPWEYSTII